MELTIRYLTVGRDKNPLASAGCRAGHFLCACGAFNKMLKKRGKGEKERKEKKRRKGGEKREKRRNGGVDAILLAEPIQRLCR